MSASEPISGRHPLCECPEVTFSSAPTAAETEACRARSGGITHAIITAEDVEAWKQSYVTNLVIEEDRIMTRPQDWAPLARQYLMERGAWRG